MKPHEYQSFSSGGVSYRFGNYVPPADKVTLTQIIDETCKKYGLTRAQLFKRGGGRKVSWPRFEAMARMRQVMIGGFPASFPRIGGLLGGLDHSSAIHGAKRYEEIMEFKRIHNLPTNTIFLDNADQYEAFRKFRKAQVNAIYNPLRFQ